ncbi:MAG TPA: BON domain-containing protein [Candidatus Angelobacter sp.]|nr:BON domain-containing protein [Candidatus Angelobacter sp.]
MIRRLSILLLLCSALAFGQQPMHLPGQPPRDNGNDPGSVNAPDTKKPSKHKSSSKDVQEAIQKALDHKNPAYRGSDIKAAVDDQNITLTGSVTGITQHEMALQIVRAYADNRRIVDKLTIQQ